MGRKRKSGEGTVRLRKDGRWEGRVVIGFFALHYLRKSECDGLSDFRGGPRQQDRSEYFDQNRQKKPPESLLYSLAASFHIGNPA